MSGMRGWFCGLIVACGAGVAILPRAAEGADWMFEPSYFSHGNAPGYVAGLAPQSRSAYRLPWAGAHPRFAVRGGLRYNNIVIRSGNSYDRTLLREGWVDVNY